LIAARAQIESLKARKAQAQANAFMSSLGGPGGFAAPTSAAADGANSGPAADLAVQSGQKLRICDVCGCLLEHTTNERRLADHFGGKMHMGFVILREKLRELDVRACFVWRCFSCGTWRQWTHGGVRAHTEILSGGAKPEDGRSQRS
jgi:hypothetical protein